eukprot:TRINITY_DN100660_c0_g1_i1.p2 TRINITY_DN100660_c0_g1~~TRINITY_DN100660_c0_g1_i1.p2  ORF type:complete len:141 (+),score=10.20 TRINITY_DN100660_c0_g1_i1:73-495(+)
MPFYESLFLLGGKCDPRRTQLILREASRSVVEREGYILRILDLGWRHTAQPVFKRRSGAWVPLSHYGHWHSMHWAGPPQAVAELMTTFQHNTGVLRYRTERLRGPNDMYKARDTFYPKFVPNEDQFRGKLEHHTVMRATE